MADSKPTPCADSLQPKHHWRKIDRTGIRYNRLIAIREDGKNKFGQIMWLCQCDCGKTTRACGIQLGTGNTKSCGCLQREKVRKMSRRHGLSKTPLYRRWSAMKDRCYCQSNIHYDRYGGRGICVCDRWLHSFENFAEDMGPTFEMQLQIERRDNDGNYCPENCYWATTHEQAKNRSHSVKIAFRGETLNLIDWAKRLGGSKKIISDRLRRGWSVERALTTPVDGRFRCKTK